MSASDSSSSTVYAMLSNTNPIPRYLAMSGKHYECKKTQSSSKCITPPSSSTNASCESTVVDSIRSSNTATKPSLQTLSSKSHPTLLSRCESQSTGKTLSENYQSIPLLPISTTNLVAQPCGRKYEPSKLRQESQSLLLTTPGDGKRVIAQGQACIFDLKFEDRQRIAALIADLASAQEQIELLQSRMELESERFQEKYRNQMEMIQELAQRCEFMASNSPCLRRVESTANTELLERKMAETLKENHDLRGQLKDLQEANTSLQNKLDALQRKYDRSDEDYKRLKWILKTIQQREEILLQNKCHASDERIQKEPPESPSNIVILKDGKNESLLSSQPPFGVDGQDIKKTKEFSTSTVVGTGRLDFPQHRSGGDFHEIPVYEPHLVIPSMASPVIMKIPRSPMALTAAPPQNTFSYPHYGYDRGGNGRIHNTHSNRDETHRAETYTNEEEILRELFYTF